MIARWLGRHRRSVAFVFVLLVAAGAASTFSLPVALFPHVDFPRIVVSVDAGDRPADRMAIEVTRPVEEALRSVPGVRRVRSQTSRGSAEISLSFDWGRDMVSSLLLTESAITRIAPTLPSGTSFDVRRMDPTVFPVIAYSLTSARLSPTELYDIAKYRLAPAIATIEGVGHTTVLGGRQEEYRITVDPERLATYGLTLQDVVNVVGASNVITAVGRIEDLHKLYLVIAESNAVELEKLGTIVLKSGEDGAVLVEDVATLSDVAAPSWTRVAADGRDAVLLQIYQQPTGNTVAVAQAVRSLIRTERPNLPPSLEIHAWYDQSELIQASAASVRDAVIVGVALACLVLLVFLRSFRVALVALIVVPGVLAVAALLLEVLGMSFNIMTLGGMAAAVGLIIDDAIVMIEHIQVRHAAASGALAAGEELTRPLVVSSTVTVVVFAPLAFLSGITGAFFKALSLTMASSLIISFFVAWLFVPIVTERLAFTGEHRGEDASPGLVMRTYDRLLSAVLRRPWVVIVALVPLLGAGWLSYRNLGSGFMPSMDEGGFIIDYRAAPGTSLTDTDALCRRLEGILAEIPEVDSYSRRTGVQLGGGLTEANEGDFFVRLKNERSRGVEAVMDDVRGHVERELPGLEIELAQLMEDLIGDLTAVPQPIEIEIFADDPEALSATANTIAEKIASVPGVVDINPGVVLAGDALHVDVDPVRAALQGMDPASIAAAVRDQIEGTIASNVQHDPKMIGIRVWVPERLRETTRSVASLRIRAPDGHVFPVGRVAEIRRVSGEPQISRDDLRRMVAVTARISGRDMGSVVADVQEVIAADGVIPSGMSHRLGGLYAEQQNAFVGLIAVFAAAVALVFFVLLFTYESFRVAASMMVTTLLSFCAVLAGLVSTGTALDISSMMGMTMVVGIVTEVSVFYVSSVANHAHEQEALRLAALERFRPIAMTTLAAILALMPLALAIGEGASMEQPLAIAVVFGLVAQMPLVLLVLPALLRLAKATKVLRRAS